MIAALYRCKNSIQSDVLTSNGLMRPELLMTRSLRENVRLNALRPAIHFRAAALVCLGMLPTLTGCLRTTRSVMQTHPPSQVLSSSLQALVASTTGRYDAIDTLNARVEVAASTGGGKQGKVVEYTTFTGYVLLRKSGDLRFVGLAPVVGSKLLDMVTDGKIFTIVIPPKSRAITGTNEISTPSSNPLENLRPTIFSDAFLIRSASRDELVSLVSDDRIYQPDPAHKYVVDEPEYDIGIYRVVANSSELKTQRVIHIGRATLMPYQQDIYSSTGQLVTVVDYDDYKLFGKTMFPSRITIHRPLDQLNLVLTVTQLSLNQALEDDQFQAPHIPENYQVQKLP